MTESNELKEPESNRVRFNSDQKDALIINALEIKVSESPDFIALAREKYANDEDLETLVLELLEIGAKAASVFSLNAGAETLKNAVENAKQGIGLSLSSATDEIAKGLRTLTSEEGDFNQTMMRVMDKFSKDIKDSLTGEEAPVRDAIVASVTVLQDKLKESITDKLDNQQKFVANLLNPNDGTSTLGAFFIEKFQTIDTVLADVQSKVTKDIIIKDALSNTTFGGLDFEAQVVSFFQNLLADTTDFCEATGDTTGYERNNRKGDAVIELATGSGLKARIVVEVKDKNMRKEDWELEAKGARRNRGAEGFIGICRTTDQMPSGGQRVWVPDLKTVVVAFDPETDEPELIKNLYNFVKLSTLSVHSVIDDEASHKLMQHLKGALKTVGDFDNAEKNLSSIKIATRNLERALSVIRGNLEDTLLSAQNVLAPSELAVEHVIDETIDAIDEIRTENIDDDDEIL